MDALQSIGVFAAQTFLILFSVLAVIIVIAILAARASGSKNEIQVELVHKKYKSFRNLLKARTLNKAEQKNLKKEIREEDKRSEKETSASGKNKKVYLIDFHGDVKASAVEDLREEITAVLTVASPTDEVVVRVESPGGMVHGYGLAAAQLLRVREKNIPLTICVDKVAASGGYMMACTGNKIFSAPFAILGSIGVVAQVPNFHNVLRKHDVHYKEYTAGEYKRTISILGEITAKGEEKFKEQLEATHILFKDFVSRYRPQLNIHDVATGEYWYGEQALTKGLVDQIRTSDDYLLELAQHHQVIKIKHEHPQKLTEKLTGMLGQALKKSGLAIIEDLEARRFL